MFKKLFLIFTIIILLSIAITAAGFYWLVVIEPGEEITTDNIHRILGRESPVFYSDGRTKLGVFFDTAHRQYVAYDEIPQDFVNALVASEDNRFFNHAGFDVIGIGRAMVKNIQAGRIVQGGSSLTQQTAKNLFKRVDRSFTAKIKELLFALRLEYHYSKEKIFEFYANQFYVSGNGHGLGVAARYYFDKKVEDLTLMECAFIAGSVKRPNYYNHFTKKTAQAVELARKRGTARLYYVLGKMRELGMIDNYSYDIAYNSDLEFKQGKVGYNLDYVMDMVRDAVSSTEVLDALEEHNISNIATSGVRVVTTIDKELQGETLSILRKELSRLDVHLRGFARETVQSELAKLDYSGDSILQKGAFLFGTIERIDGEGEGIRVAVSLDKNLGQGYIDAIGLFRLLRARVKWQRNSWTKLKEGDQEKLVAQLQPGDRVWVSVRIAPTEGSVILDLEKYPKVQGGALVVKDGRIKGMAGGTENRFFNRAIHAKRTVGSAFKPLVFTAALQLGWNNADLLKNNRDIFVYQNQAYFPRPDHKSPHTDVSMNWTGSHSENLASVWLLSHLCDQLSPLQFHDLAQNLGLAPRRIDGDEEPYRTYRARIRDSHGIRVDRRILRSTAYRLAVDNLETDFIFAGMLEEHEILKKLHYGLNYDRYTEDIDNELVEKKMTLTTAQVKELMWRKDLLGDHYLGLESLRQKLTIYKTLVEETTDDGKFAFVGLESDTLLYVNRQTRKFYFLSQESKKESLFPVNNDNLRKYLKTLDKEATAQFWQNVNLGDILAVSVFDKVMEQVDHEYQKLLARLPYSFEILSQVDDFRIMVGMYYLIHLAKQLGIQSNLKPVLSLPLGSNVVNLLEATRMYEVLISGEAVTFEDGQGEVNDSLAILDRIESAEGIVLYRPKAVRKKVIDQKTSIAISNILANVVKFGTGRRASKKVILQDGVLRLVVPFLGKTGTANRYIDASFLGYLPGIAKDGGAMTLRNGYALGVYVGFDNNEPMQHKNTRIYGATGALPAWAEIANVVVKKQQYADKLDLVDLSFYGLGIKMDHIGQLNIGVDPSRGGRVVEPVVQIDNLAHYQPSIMTFGRQTAAGRFVPERAYLPFWKIAAEVEQ